MKARIKETGEIVEILSCFASHDGHSTHYGIDELDFIELPTIKVHEPAPSIDWEQRRFEMVKAAMQGVLSSWTVGIPTSNSVVRQSFEYAYAVLDEYRKGDEQ